MTGVLPGTQIVPRRNAIIAQISHMLWPFPVAYLVCYGLAAEDK